MRIGTAARLVRSLGLFFVTAFALGAGAAQLTILLDTDNNVATGCTVATPGGPFAGVETVLTTQVVTTTSPLLLDRADVVAFLHGGRVVATGTHADLLDSNAEYRRVVTRESEPDLAVSEVTR